MGITAQEFRGIALSHAGAVESAHMRHPDFRISGRIFASLGYPDEEHAMVRLTPADQAAFIRRNPEAFAPSAGAWGLSGCTRVHLPRANRSILETAMRAAVAYAQSKERRAR